tara:strand:- start:41 stop:253 length:213 start_codon:yes stop_codon:yes gene_type:complete
VPETTLKFKIDQDGNVKEEVIGVVCSNCTDITQRVENDLGSVVSRTLKGEYYQPCTINQTGQDEIVAQIE